MNRRPKHDPARARTVIRFVGPPIDPETRRLQAWSLQQFVSHGLEEFAKRPGAVA